MVILIDNLKKIRNFIYFFKINDNLINSNFILFCYNLKFTNNVKNEIRINKINYHILKRSKQFDRLNFIRSNFKNHIVLFYCSDIKSLINILNISEIYNTIIFCKVNNFYYSINDLKSNLNSMINFINYLDKYYLNIINFFEILKQKKNNY